MDKNYIIIWPESIPFIQLGPTPHAQPGSASMYTYKAEDAYHAANVNRMHGSITCLLTSTYYIYNVLL